MRKNQEFQYFFTMDDTILSLEQATKNRNASIFDTPFFGMLKDVHDTHGFKINLGLFYETSPGYHLGDENWDLTMMADAHKDEFEENADWLQFSFHAWNYETEYSKENRDFYDDLVATKAEVERFAGLQSWNESDILIHFYNGTRRQLKRLTDKLDKWVVLKSRPYQLTGSSSSYLSPYEFSQLEIYKDPNTKICHMLRHGVIERIIGVNQNDRTIYPNMKGFLNDLKTRRFIDIGSHEYHFIEDHSSFRQSVVDSLYDSAEWMNQNNYEPSFPTPDLYHVPWL